MKEYRLNIFGSLTIAISVFAFLVVVIIAVPILWFLQHYVPVDEAQLKNDNAEKAYELAVERQDPTECFVLDDGPLYWILDLDNPWKPFWNPIRVHYPKYDCVVSYRSEIPDAASCDLYDDLDGFSKEEQTWCYRYVAQANYDPSVCQENDYFCLAMASNNIDYCLQIGSTERSYNSEDVTPAYCIQYTDFFYPETRDVQHCTLIDETTGWDWRQQRNNCLGKYVHMEKSLGNDFQYICDLAVEPEPGTSSSFRDCGL